MRISAIPMSARPWRLFVLAVLGLVAVFGTLIIPAGAKDKKDGEESDRKEPKTIGDIVSVAGLNAFPAEGVGLIVGLEETGSDPLPGNDRGILLLEMQKRGITNAE